MEVNAFVETRPAEVDEIGCCDRDPIEVDLSLYFAFGRVESRNRILARTSTAITSRHGEHEKESVTDTRIDDLEPGTLSMANTGSPNSGGSQFFMNVADNKNLDWFSPGSSKHPVFGKVISGMDIATKISKVRTKNDTPVNPIRMNKITISGL